MSGATSGEYPITTFLRELMAGRSRDAFVRSLGYWKRIDRGRHRLDLWMDHGDGHEKILRQIAIAYPDAAQQLKIAVEATRKVKAEEQEAARKRQCVISRPESGVDSSLLFGFTRKTGRIRFSARWSRATSRSCGWATVSKACRSRSSCLPFKSASEITTRRSSGIPALVQSCDINGHERLMPVLFSTQRAP